MYYDSISIVEGTNVKGVAVPSGTSFPQNANAGELFYRTDTSTMYVAESPDPANPSAELTWVSFGGTGGSTSAVPKISSVQITDSSFTAIDDTAVSTGGGYIKITGTGFQAGCIVIIGETLATSVTLVSDTEIRAVIPALTAAVYALYVINTDGGTGIKPNGLEVSAFPVWSTASTLPLQKSGVAVSIQLFASESATFALANSSSLPTGLSLSSSGLISGTVSGLSLSTTYSFTIIATDAQNQNTSRTFSLTVSPLAISSVQVVNGAFTVLDDTAVDTAGGYIKINGVGFQSGCTVSLATNVTFVSSTEIYAQIPATTAGTYNVTVTNPDGDSVTSTGALVVSNPPVWSTSATLATQYVGTATSIQLSASESATFALASGSSLPTGLSLSSSGLISGTVTSLASTQTFTFAIVATDAQNQDVSRTFTMKVSTLNISSVQVVDSLFTVLDDTAVNTTGGYIKINGTGFQSGCTVAVNGVSATSVTFSSSSVIYAQLPATAAGTYSLTVTNAADETATRSSSVIFSAFPAWSTSAALPIQYSGSAISIQLSAPSATSYALKAGSTLPSGLSLSASGLLSGSTTVTDTTSYTFTVVATDAERQDSEREFTLRVSIMTVGTIIVTDSSYTNLDDTAVDTTGGYIKVTGTGFKAGCTLTVGSTPATSTTFVAATEIRAQVPATSAGTYAVTVTNSDGDMVTKASAVVFSPSPAWVTAQSLPDQTSEVLVNIQLAASLATSYTLAAGSTLPPALSLTTAGLLSGTFTGVTSTQSYTFTITATDAENQSSDRTFTLAVNPAAATTQSNTRLTSLLMKSSAVEGANTLGYEDASSNNFSITRNGNVTETSLSPFNGSGWSTYFDGSGDYIYSSGTMPSGTESFCIEGWFFVDGGLPYLITGNTYYVSRLVSGVGTGALEITIGSASGSTTVPSSLSVNAYASPASFSFGVSGLSIPVNTWHHFAVVRHGSLTAMYLNGVRVGSYTNSYGFAANNNIRIGGAADAAAGYLDYFKGYLSNIRIVKGSPVYDPMIPQIKVPTAPLTDIPGTTLLTCNSPNHSDTSPARTTLTVYGDTVVKSFSPFVSYRATENSLTGGSVYFDGAGDYLNAASPNLSGDFTVECWWYPLNTTTQQTIISFNSGGYTGINIWCNTSGQLVVDNGQTAQTAFTGTLLVANQWNHVAVVRSGTTTRGYINGILAGSNTFTPSAITNIQIGRFNGGAGGSTFYYTSGYISNVRVVNGTALYTANFTPSTSALTAVSGTSLLTCQSSPIRDASSNNFVITSVGDAKYSVMGPFRSISSGSSVYFDGSGDYLTSPGSTAFTFGTADFTVEYWVYHTSVAATYNQHVGASTTTNGFAFGNNGTALKMYMTTSNVGYTSTGPSFSLNKWHHFAFCRSAGTVTFFLDGVVNFTTTAATNITETGMGIGSAPTGNYPMTGYLSNVRVVKGTALYTSNFTPSTSPLTAVAGTSLLTCQSSAIVDNSANAFTITRYGHSAIVNAGPFVSAASDSYTFADPTSGGSAYFDGGTNYLTLPSTFNAAMGGGFASGTKLNTIEAWIYPTVWTALNAYQMGIYGNFQAVAANGRFVLQVLGNSTSSNGKVQFAYTTGTGTYVTLSSQSSIIQLNAWAHIAITIDATTSSSSTIKFFVNGVLTDTFTSQNLSTQTSNYTAPFLGGNTGAGINAWAGYISNFRHTYGSLLYTSNFTPSTSALTAVSGTALLTFQSNAVIDASSNNFTLTATGKVISSTIGPFTANVVSGSAYTPATPAGSVYFDGTGDYLGLTTNTAFSYGTGDFTIEAWIYPTSNSAQGIVGHGDGSAGNPYLYLNGLTPTLYFNNTAVATSTNVTLNSWNHVAVTRSGTSVRVFTNGVSGTLATNSTSLSNTVLLIGISSAATQAFNGYISNVRIVKGTALYTSNFTPSTSPLTAVAGTSLLTCQSGGIKDSSSNNFAVTPVGDAKTVGVTPFDVPALGKSVYFDGTGDRLSILASSTFDFGTGDFTIEAWVYPVSFGNTLAIFNHWDGNQNSARFSVNLSASGVQCDTTSGLALTWSGSTTVSLNQWVHCAVVRQGNTFRTYTNGILCSTATSSNAYLPTLAPISIGDYANDFATGYGYISNLRIVKGTAVYTANFTPSTSPLTAVSGTSLLTCQSAAIVDNSTNAFTITRNGDARSTDFTPFTLPAKSTYAGSVYFDGTGDSLSIPDSEAFNFGTGNFTVECWVNFNNVSSSPWFFTQWQSSTNTDTTSSFYLIVGSSKISAGVAYNNSTTQFALNSTTTITNGQWYHVALVRNGSASTLYLNGVAEASNTTLGSMTVNNGTVPVLLGMRTGGVNYLNGYISNARIVKGTAVYTSNFVPPTGPLAAIPGTVFLLDNASPGIYDATQKIAMETVGTVADVDTTAVVKKFNSSVFFDGSGSYIKIPPTPELSFDSGNFTVEFWAYFLNGSENVVRGIYTSYPQTNTFVANALFIGKHNYSTVSGKMSLWLANNPVSGPLLIDSTLPASNTWIHYAFTRNGNTFTMWRNGVSVATATYSGVVNVATNNNFIGASPDLVSTGCHYGYIEDLRVVKGQALYTSTFTPPAAALTI